MDKHFVYFRFPGETVINGWSLASPQNVKCIDENQKGFFLYPFDHKHSNPLFFPFTQSIEPDLSFNAVRLNEGSKSTIDLIDKEKYSSIINEFKKQINPEFQKVVLSRQIQIDKNPKYLPILFQKLISNFPNAFVWLLHSEEIGTYLGASPELLLKKTKNSLQTVALAGTRPLNDPEFSKKEIEEQAFVQSYIESWLKGNHLSFRKSDTNPVQAGEILHLQTKYKIDAAGFSPEMINDLHPTPAVCGTPKGMAKDFIQMHEGYDRKYYAGYIGPVFENQFQLFVNIRSAQLFKEHLIVSAGGGITKGSDPEAEWMETSWKASLFYE